MKRILFILLFFLAYHCLCSQFTITDKFNKSDNKDVIITPVVSSGWNIGKGYKEQRLRIPEITFIKFSKDGKFIFTFSKDNIFRKWDTETGLLLNEKLFSYQNIANVFLDYDDRYLAIATFEDSISYNQNLITYMWDYPNDSLFYSFNAVVETHGATDNTNTKLAFYHNLDNFITGIDVYKEEGGGDSHGGRLDLWNKSTGKHISLLIDTYSPNSFIISPNDNNSAITLKWASTPRRGNGSSWSESRLFFDNYTNSDILPDVANAFLFTSDSKILIGLSGNQRIFVRNIQEKKNIINWSMFSIDSGNQINSIKLSKDNKYLVTSSFYNGDPHYDKWYSAIRFWHLLSGAVIDSIIFNQTIKWLLDLSPDSVSLVAGSDDGIIRLYYPQIFSSIKDVNLKSVKLFPNPATNQVLISYNLVSESDVTIEITNILGYNVRELFLPYQSSGIHETMIELYGLPPGLYFLQFRTNEGIKTYKLQVL